jgi:hypothetical protein
MSHEQSETVQLPSGKWHNVFGRGTSRAGQRLPDTGEFDTVHEAVRAAGERSRTTWKRTFKDETGEDADALGLKDEKAAAAELIKRKMSSPR